MRSDNILIESRVRGDLRVLARAWEEPATFAVLPDRSDVTSTWVEDALSRLPARLGEDHFALLSSGSTGRPKLVLGSRSRAEALAATLHRSQQGEDVRRTVLGLPLNYCYAFVNQWLWARVHDRELVVTEGLKDPPSFGAALADVSDASLCMVGAQVPLMERAFAGRSFPGITRLHFAGGPFPQHRMAAIRSFFPNATVFNNYGCVEAMPRLTLRTLEESDDPSNVGRALPGVTLKRGPEQEILFRSAYRAVATFGVDGWRELDDDEWLPSGDNGQEQTDGSWRVEARSKEVFKRYGEKVSLARLRSSVEEVWCGQAAFYREMDPNGEPGHVLVLSPDPSAPDVKKVMKTLRSNYGRPHWPVRIEGMNRMPLLANGKVDFRNLATSDERTLHWRQRL